MMNKNIFLCIGLLMYATVAIGSEPHVDEIIPTTFAQQVDAARDFINTYAQLVQARAYKAYNDYMVQQEVQSVSIQKKKSDIARFHLSKTQKYMIGATIACVIAAGLAYHYGWFAKDYTVSISEQEVQAIIETVVHDSLVSKKDQLNKIFEILVSNGLTDIVVYNDHMFEVNEQFRVELRGNLVKVTRI